eukprot:5077585-Pyramimonas_sp.AAC.1
MHRRCGAIRWLHLLRPNLRRTGEAQKRKRGGPSQKARKASPVFREMLRAFSEDKLAVWIRDSADIC